jgi:hypothetical protein
MDIDGNPPETPMIRWETGYPPHRTFGEWHEDPWADPADIQRRKVERHKRWIASISESDWKRLADLADRSMAGEGTTRLDNLDSHIAIGAYPETMSHPPNGERFGTLRGCTLMAWPKATRSWR